MRVGVLTFHHVANYGAALQAVALQRALERQGHEVEVIDYRPRGARRHYRTRWYPVRRSSRRPNRRFAEHGLKAARFERFVRQELQLTAQQKGPGVVLEDGRFDAVVVGSDQVWDVRSRIRGFDPAYFLDFVPDGTARVAFGASFGATVDVGAHRDELVRLLERFDAVAVRDAGSVVLAGSLGRPDAVGVGDPTCLEPLWDLAVDPGAARPYLVLYAEQRLEPDEAAAVRRIADRRGLEVVAVGFSHPVADRCVVGAGPREWLGWMRGADYVVTSMYHGTIFGALAGKPLSVFLREGRRRKLGDLLTALDLWDRVGTEADERPWDPAPVQDRLDELAERSRRVLRWSLGADVVAPAVGGRASGVELSD